MNDHVEGSHDEWNRRANNEVTSPRAHSDLLSTLCEGMGVPIPSDDDGFGVKEWCKGTLDELSTLP